ncbi:MAG: hypothetical protein EXS35_01275 [Pedosphaera sp.]|nr:hypothetical protein [Pedosphaera sp.]
MLFFRTKILPPVVFLFLYAGFACVLTQAQTSNVTVRVMASNLSSGNNQRYESPGLDILQGLKPDLVAMQEFNVTNQFGFNTTAAISNMVATTFGTNFSYYRETGYNIPNGVISRYPILSSGSWPSDVGDRGYAWAQIDLPGTNNLYLVSVHLKASSGSATQRASEAGVVKSNILFFFPAGAWIIVAGDMNLYSETEGAIVTFKTFLSDSPVPADQSGDQDTNAGRAERYDRVLPSFSFTNTLTPVVLPSHTFANGLVFDSRVYTPLTDVPPVVSGDSGATGMQHMGVVKDFLITFAITNGVIAPVITNQPQSLTVTQNNNANFTVLAGGTAPLSYQWRFGATNIGGATASSYTRTAAQANDTGNYTVVITNTAGSVTSSVATLTVLVPPGIATPPQSLTVTQNNNATFTVVATGNPAPAYQWRFGTTNIAGATTSAYTRVNAQTNDAGNYTVVLTNAAGGLTSAVATLTVLVPPGIATQPQSLTVTQNNNATFTVAATGTATLGYQWRFNAGNIAGATASSYTRSNAQTNDAGNYTVVITNSAGGLTSAVATLTVLVPPGISTPPQNQTVSQAANATFTVTASGSVPLGYQWRFNSASIAGATASSFTRANAQPTDVGNYTVVVTNAAGGVTSAPASLALQIPAPLLTILSADVIQWQVLSNLIYSVEGKTNVESTNWTSLGTASSPSNTVWFTYPPAGEILRLYRVVYP